MLMNVVEMSRCRGVGRTVKNCVLYKESFLMSGGRCSKIRWKERTEQLRGCRCSPWLAARARSYYPSLNWGLRRD